MTTVSWTPWRRIGPALLAAALVAAAGLGVAARPGDSHRRAALSLELHVVDETGRPVRGATFSAAGHNRPADASGVVTVEDGRAVVAGSLAAPGFLREPVVVGPESDGHVVTVRLWASRGGRRFSYHAAGDVMLGRRYHAPRQGASTARLDRARLEESARAVVADVAPIFRAATFGTVNLETVVGNLPSSAAYPGKDLVIQTPPGALAALEELGVDAALGANNHVWDYRAPGVASTRRTVEGRGIAYGGAGLDEPEAARPVRLGRASTGLVVLSFSAVTGDGVNDTYSGEIARAWRTFRALERRDPAAAAARGRRCSVPTPRSRTGSPAAVTAARIRGIRSGRPRRSARPRGGLRRWSSSFSEASGTPRRRRRGWSRRHGRRSTPAPTS